MNILAIDPGDIHVGVAWFKRGPGGRGAWCDTAFECRPAEIILTMEKDKIETVVVEEFRLYPWAMREQGFSPFKTVELIGILKYIANKRKIELVMQPASIKVPTEGILRSKGIVLRSRGHGSHAKDAELHGYFYNRANLKEQGE